MPHVILRSKGTFFTCQTLHKFLNSELVCESEKRKHNLFDNFIEIKIGSYVSYLEKHIPERYISYEDDSEEVSPLLPDNSNPVESDGTL